MWKEIISDLVSAGLTQHQIASRIGVSQAYISDLASGKRGKRIGFAPAQRLIDTHAECCPGKAGQASSKEPA